MCVARFPSEVVRTLRVRLLSSTRLYDVGKYYKRNGLFQTYLRTGCVPMSRGQLAVDSVDAVHFTHGGFTDPEPYSFDKPCHTR